MKEITVKDNPLGLRVFINGVPDLRLIPKDTADAVIAALEIQICDYAKRKSSKS